MHDIPLRTIGSSLRDRKPVDRRNSCISIPDDGRTLRKRAYLGDLSEMQRRNTSRWAFEVHRFGCVHHGQPNSGCAWGIWPSGYRGTRLGPRNLGVACMNLLFPDRDSLARDPLGFLLSKADSASAPMVPLALGFHRVFLVTDLAFITDGPFCPGTLRIPASPFSLFSPIEISQARARPRIVGPKTVTSTEDCSRIIDGITHQLLVGLRKSIFSAYRHASFDCWRFASILSTKLTFIALFGSRSEDIIDYQIFSHHAAIVHSFKDSAALDVICKRERERKEKERACEPSLQLIQESVEQALSAQQYPSVYKFTHKTFSSLTELCQLVIAVQQTTAVAIFWALFVLSRTRSLRKIVEEEADACLSSDGDLAKDKLNVAHLTRDVYLEILRLVPLNNFIVFNCRTRSILADQELSNNDKIVICPHAIFRSEKYFLNAKKIAIRRKYDADYFRLQQLSCGGGIIFQLASLNLALLLLDLAAAFELDLVEGPSEFIAPPGSRTVRPDIKVRLNLRRSRLFR